MINHIKNDPNVYAVRADLPNMSGSHAGAPIFRDTLRPQIEAAPSLLTRIVGSVALFFKKIFGCLFPSTTNKTSLEKIKEIADRDHFIWFYDKKQNPLTESFSNYYHPCTIGYEGLTFDCSEALFQSQKFKDPNIRRQFQKLDGDGSKKLARQLSRNWTAQDHQVWRSRSETVMMGTLALKYQQHPKLKDMLLATGSAYLVEHGKDKYWGDGGDGMGRNKLGESLMRVREELGGTGVVAKPENYTRFIQSIHH